MIELAKTIKSEKDPAMVKEQIATWIAAMPPAERLPFIVAMADVQKVVHEMSEENRKILRQFAEIFEVIAQLDAKQQRIAFALLGTNVLDEESANSLMKKYNPR